jgi:tRNA1(Val) A37 N6-methylase TrmN6
MRELIRTNDAVLVSAVEALLKGAGIPHLVLDQNMSVLEGSLGVLPRRIMVPSDHVRPARRLLDDAGLGRELRPDEDVTEDAALGTRLKLRQPRKGHRFGHDAILLAAATGARRGEQIVDLGAGVGAAGLALAMRIPDATVTLIDIDPDLVDLAAENAKLNGLDRRVRSIALDVGGSEQDFAREGLAAGTIDRVLMNPPFNDPERHSRSPDLARARAHQASWDTVVTWTTTAARLLVPNGILTLIWRTEGLGQVLSALERSFGAVTVLPVHPRADAPAIRVLVRAIRGSGGPFALLPGFALNDARGRATPEAESVLRGGAPLPLAEP